MRLGLALDERGTVGMKVTLTRERPRPSRGRFTIATWTRSIRYTSTGNKEVRLILSDRASRKVRGAVNARLRVQLTATDANGNRRSSTVRWRLAR